MGSLSLCHCYLQRNSPRLLPFLCVSAAGNLVLQVRSNCGLFVKASILRARAPGWRGPRGRGRAGRGNAASTGVRKRRGGELAAAAAAARRLIRSALDPEPRTARLVGHSLLISQIDGAPPPQILHVKWTLLP